MSEHSVPRLMEGISLVRQLVGKAPIPADSALGAPSTEVALEIVALAAVFPLALAGDTTYDALNTLRRASGPTATVEDRVRATQLIRLFYLPVMRRRAVAPEKHARDLVDASAELGALMGLHLARLRDRSHDAR